MKPHPWFNPLPRRILTMAACILWLLFEAWFQPSSLWFWMAIIVNAYAFYDFFMAGHYPVAES